LTKFVSAKIPFEDKLYIPKNLTKISWKYVYDAKWWTQFLKEEAKNALDNMSKSYYNVFWKKIVVVSAYRPYLYQKWIKDRWCPDNLCAKAGYSEHQSWLAVDLWAASSYNAWQTKNYQIKYNWLKENAYKFGFHNTYQKWLKIDTYEIEPWHWRYLWESLAKYLLDNNLTIAEFYNKMEQH
jgi:D-alanyl-D-alanine carboxypeptidase